MADSGLNHWKVCSAAGLWSFQLSHFSHFGPSLRVFFRDCWPMETSGTWGRRNLVPTSNLRWWKTNPCPFISVTVWVRYCSRSFPPLPVRHVRSAVVPTNRRHQSHWLRKHSLPISPLLWRQLLGLVSQIYSSMCSASKEVYLYTVATHKHTHVHMHETTLNSFITFPGTKVESHWICHCPVFLFTYLFF